MEENNTPVVVNYSEFGLAEDQASKISTSFEAKIIERDGYMEVYKNLLTREIDLQTCKDAKTLRNKLVKVRTGIADVHKAEKALYLAAGRYCDALKNKYTLSLQQMEQTLQDVEDHFDNLEKEKLDKIESDRLALLAEFTDFNRQFFDLRNMSDELFDQLLTEQRDLKQFKIEKAAKEKAEADAKAAKQELEDKRRHASMNLAAFIPNYSTLVFSDLTEEEFKLVIVTAIGDKADKELEEQRIKDENAKLKAEAEMKAAVRTKRNLELRPYIVLIRDYNTMLEMEESAYQTELAEIKKAAEFEWAAERDKQIKEAAKAEAEEKERQKELQKNAKAEAELKALKKAEADRIVAETKRLADIEAAEKAKLLLGDAEKFEQLTREVDAVFARYEFTSEEYRKRVKTVKNTNITIFKVGVDYPIKINIS